VFLLPSAIGAIQQDPIRRIFKQASLDLQFAEKKSLVDATTGAQLVTFTRASSGTFVGSDGVLRTATTNLLLQSENFGTTWDVASTPVAVTTNTEAAPDGTTTADTLSNTANTSTEYRIVQSISTSSQVAFTVYIKQGTHSFVQFRTNSATSGFVNFDLSGITSSATTASGQISDAGNGWRRCTAVFAAAAIASVQIQFVSSLSATRAESWAPTGTISIYVWGAQLEQSSTVGEYIPTTSTINSAPRFDHNPTTGESLGLLVEEQRTNSIRNNTMVGAVAGTPGTIPTNWDIAITGSGITREIVGVGIEDGITYIDIRYFGTGSGSVIPQIRPETTTQIVAAVGQAWTASYYLKVAAGSTAGAFSFSQIWQERDAVGVVLNTVTVTIPEPTTAALGTQRNVLTRTLTNAGTARLTNRLQFSFTNGVAIDITLRIGLPQLEQGAFATSVIPTSTTAVTRSADVASISGSNFSSWYRQDEGTVFAEYGVGGGTQSRYPFSISDDTLLNRFSAFNSGSTGLNFRLISGNVAFNPGILSVNASGNSKIALAAFAASNGTIGSSNGALSTPGSPSAMPVVDRMYIGLAHNGLEPLNGAIRRLTYWPTRLPDSTLQTLTQ
jgi:hypothetical protein